jgi:hypothetical protein
MEMINMMSKVEMDRKIEDYLAELELQAHRDMRYQQWMDAVHHDVVDLVCPICGEELWYELGYWSLYEQLLWEGFYYPCMYGWDMGLSHYRRE